MTERSKAGYECSVCMWTPPEGSGLLSECSLLYRDGVWGLNMQSWAPMANTNRPNNPLGLVQRDCWLVDRVQLAMSHPAGTQISCWNSLNVECWALITGYWALIAECLGGVPGIPLPIYQECCFDSPLLNREGHSNLCCNMLSSPSMSAHNFIGALIKIRRVEGSYYLRLTPHNICFYIHSFPLFVSVLRCLTMSTFPWAGSSTVSFKATDLWHSSFNRGFFALLNGVVGYLHLFVSKNRVCYISLSKL